MAVEKERAALQSKENLNPKEELQNLMNQLKELTESGEGRKKLSKKLNEWVSLFLKNHQDVVWTVKQIYEWLDSASKEWLQSLMKLAKVDEEVRDEQREINVRLEALREQQTLSEEVRGDANKLKDAVKLQLTSKINELYKKWDYQWALDNAVYLLSAEDRIAAFSLIKAILKATPSNETLYIKDKKISYSKRREWIQKMENNMEAAAREFQASYYPDVSVSDEWTLDKSSKKHSDKKAAKLLDKELSGNKDLYDIIKHVNVPSAWELIEKNYKAIEDAFKKSEEMHPNDKDAAADEFKNLLKKEFFVSHGYLPKSWEKLSKADDLKDKEWYNLLSLCTYRVMSQLEAPVQGKPSAKSSYETLVLSQVAWVATSELEQARNVLNQVSVEGLTWDKAKETLMALLWDLNWDGRVTNTSIREWVDRKWLDKWTLFWGQIASMFDWAINRFTEEKVIQNVESIINWLNWLKGFKVEPKTIVGLVSAFKDRPEALIAFRNKLMNEPDSWMSMFNVGSEYVDRKIDRLKSEEKFRKELTDFLKTESWKKVEEQLDLHFDSIFEEEIVKKVLPNLKKFKESNAYNELTKGQKEHIDALINKLSTPEWRREFLSDPQVKAMYRNFIISGLWINLSDIKVDGEDIFWVGVWASVSSEKLNNFISKLTNDVFNKASGSVGLYCADWNVSLWLWLGFWASKNIWENARVFYNAWASWSPFSPKGLSFSAVVGEETRVNPKASDSLDLGASHYIWVAGAYGLWLNLSDPNLNTNNVSLSVYWRKDKLERVNEKAEQVKQKMAPIFEHLFETQWEITVESILQNLRGGKMNNWTEFNWFSKTSWETLYKTAVAIYNMINSYKSKLGVDNKAAIKELSENFAANLAREMRNKDIEKIVDEWLHLSWASIGVSLSFARLFTGFFISWGLTFTYYEDSRYNENEDMLRKAERWMENPDNYEVITNGEKTYEEKMKIINKFLNANYLKYSPALVEERVWWEKIPACITLSKDVFWKDVKVLCHPDLAPYIIQDNGEIKLPWNADVSLAKIMHQWKAEYTLILGNDSSNGCEAVSLENDKLKWEGNSTVEFGSKKDEFEKYNVKIETKTESMKVWLDWKPNDALKKYLEDNWDALVKFRLANANYKKFISAAQASRDDKFVENTIKYLPDELKNLVVQNDESQASHDIRFIYASLSRVSQTRDKQLEGAALRGKAVEYLDKLNLSLENRSLIGGYISKVEGGVALTDEEWWKMKRILGIGYNNWEYRTSISNAEKLFHILTPVKKLAEHRTAAYERRIKSEYSALKWGADVLITARNSALERLNNVPTAKGDLKEWWIGAVAWYDDRNSITDKFVSSPKIINWSEAIIPDSENLNIVKKHFLNELSRDDAAQFSYIKDKIVSTLEKSFKKEDKELAQKWREMHDAEFIDAILNEKTKNEKWEDVLKVSFNMQYGFFADCVNETILLGDINVITTTEEQIQAPHDVHYYEAIVTNDAVTTARSLSIWATYGEVKTKELDQPEESEEPKEPKEPIKPEDETEPVETPTWSTEPFVDIDALWNATEVDFNNKQMEYNGQTYHVLNKTIDWHKCVIAINETTREKYIVVQNASWSIDLVAYDGGGQWPSVLANAESVSMKNHEEFLEKHRQWEEKHRDYLKKYEDWEKAHKEREIAHKEREIDHKEWEENHWKAIETQEAYMKRHEEIIRALPTIYQGVVKEIMILNYKIYQAKPWESSDLINQRRELIKKVDASIIDRMIHYS